MMTRRLLLITAGVLVGALLSTTPLAQTLSDQVLLLLARDNTWSGEQTFDDAVGLVLESAAAPHATPTNRLENRGGALYWNNTLVGALAGASGTVTSVAMTAPTDVFDIAGSPIVAAGTLAVTFDTQLANVVFAGPGAGGAVAPTFRALVDADIPDNITISGVDAVSWVGVDKTGSSLADLATALASDLTGLLPLANVTDGGTAGVPLVAGGGASDPSYTALDLSSATAVAGVLQAASFPALAGDVTTVAGSLTTDIANSGVAAASYGTSLLIPSFTVAADGRITAASSAAIGTVDLLDGARQQDTTASTVTRGDVIVGNAAGAWDDLAVGAAGTFLRSDATDVAWGTDGSALTALDADAIATNEVVLARGGTNASLTAVNGGVVYSTATALAITAAGVNPQCLISNGAAAPTWGACATLAAHDLLSATHGDTAVAAVSRGSIIVGNSTPDWSELTAGGAGTMLRSDGTDVIWSVDGSALNLLNATNISSGTLDDNRLSSQVVLLTGLQTLSGDKTFTGTTTFTGNTLLNGPTTTMRADLGFLAFDENAQAADNQLWDFLVSGTTLTYRAANDARSAVEAWLTVTRTAEAIGAVTIPNGTFTMTEPFVSTGIAFASLGTPSNGTVTYCTDCLAASSPCTGSSTGTMAFRLNGAWECF